MLPESGKNKLLAQQMKLKQASTQVPKLLAGLWIPPCFSSSFFLVEIALDTPKKPISVSFLNWAERLQPSCGKEGKISKAKALDRAQQLAAPCAILKLVPHSTLPHSPPPGTGDRAASNWKLPSSHSTAFP